mgnify:CR=1 FL=1
MAIKLNGVDITSNKLNTADITSEKFNGIHIYPASSSNYEWVFITYHSSEPDDYNYYLTGNYGGNIDAMLTALQLEYSAGKYNLGYIAVIAEQSDYNFYVFECQEV